MRFAETFEDDKERIAGMLAGAIRVAASVDNPQ